MGTLHGFSDNKYEFLSNFYACRIHYANEQDPEGTISYPTVEHAFQAAKATNYKDMQYVADAATPGEAKQRGRKVQLRSDWEEVKDNIMLDLLRIKFQNPDMQWRMLQTLEDKIDDFCEDNWWHDNYWGNCNCPRCRTIIGQNMLGKLRTQVRNEIVTQEAPPENH